MLQNFDDVCIRNYLTVLFALRKTTVRLQYHASHGGEGRSRQRQSPLALFASFCETAVDGHWYHIIEISGVSYYKD